MNLHHLTFGCFGMSVFMLFCALTGFLLEARPDVLGWVGQGLVMLLLVAFLIGALALGLRLRQSFRKPIRGWFSDLWLRKEK